LNENSGYGLKAFILIILLCSIIGIAGSEEYRIPIKNEETQSSESSTYTKPTIPKNGIIVYVTDYGEKYHLKDCQYLKYSRHAIDLADAVSSYYSPCSVCQPPELETTPIEMLMEEVFEDEENNTTQPVSK